MRRTVVLMAVVAMLAALAVVTPASAGHNQPVNISVSSAYAGVCGAKPGAPIAVPAVWTGALNANNLGPVAFRIPADLKAGTPLGSQAGVCNFSVAGTDALWSATRSVLNFPGCNATSATACKGLHLPGLGAPARPGRFIQFAAGNAPQTATNICNFVSSNATNGTCTQLAIGYVDPGDSGFGGYCGSSESLFWGLAGDKNLSLASRIYTVSRWAPNSAGTILPISGTTAAANWQPKVGHYAGFTNGTPGNRVLKNWPNNANVFGLASARSYVPNVDNTPAATGSCAGSPNTGALQFLSQQVLISLGS